LVKGSGDKEVLRTDQQSRYGWGGERKPVQRRRRSAIAVAAALSLPAVLGGCGAETDPATNVSPSTAQLNGRGTLNPGLPGGTVWWEYSGDGGQTWTQTHHDAWGRPSCTYDRSLPGTVPFRMNKYVSGLLPGRHYIFRIASNMCGGGVVRWDSKGVGGRAYDSFYTGAPYRAGSWPNASWRPFNDNSPFNTPVDHSRVDPNSAAIVNFLLGSNPGPDRWSGNDCWVHPVYFARASDPLYTAHENGNRYNGLQFHLPAGARPDPCGDGHLAVIDQATGWEYDFWQASISGNTVNSNGIGRTRIDGTGVDDARTYSGADAANFGLAAGNLRAQEVQAGQVNHALFLVVPCVNGTVWPATGGAAQCGAGNPGLHLGTRLFLELSQSQINNLSIPTWQKTILQALRVYGGFVGDTGGGGRPGFKIEGPETYATFGVTPPWVTYRNQLGLSVFNMKNAIDWHNLRVALP
jgi:hypothetical protein